MYHANISVDSWENIFMSNVYVWKTNNIPIYNRKIMIKDKGWVHLPILL